MPAEGDLRSNGIERSGQIVRVYVPIVLLVVQAYYLLNEDNVADRFGHTLDDHHLTSTLKVDRDGGMSNQVRRSKRPGAEVEGIVEPDTPYRATVRLAIRTSRRDPIVARPVESLRCPRPWKLRRSHVATKHTRLADFRIASST